MHTTISDIIESWKKNLALLQKNEEVLIVSGEAFFSLFESLKDHIIEKSKTLNIKFKMISGPIISVNDKTQISPIIDLAEKGFIELYISPYRQSSHYVIFGNKTIYIEEYHTPLAQKRNGLLISDAFLIAKHKYDFYNNIAMLKMEKYPKCNNQPIFLYKKQIDHLYKELDYKYDFINRDILKEFFDKNLQDKVEA